ncbi:hypothetical protein SLEP1_g27433 [Rubroshorea leprosula]|uniref:Uncharacterized protein n=1 Tax=Rubroshorea leprosula TaxID=152421 RepID=A0AAV5JZS3_9ROSI|nr:hypothetical protein SLEP1_g27433 [Rubroshorea leprosula]
MSQHQDPEDLRKELDQTSAQVLENITSLRCRYEGTMKVARATTRIMHKNYMRLITLHYFIIALLLFVVALDLLKFMAIP